MHKMDNETSADIEHFIPTQNAALQYVPLDKHLTNAVEQAIQTWKNHYISGLASLPKDFPTTYWSTHQLSQHYAEFDVAK